MNEIERNIKLYLEQEIRFLSGVLNLLGIEYTITEDKSCAITAKEMRFKANNSEMYAIGAMMKVNYERIAN